MSKPASTAAIERGTGKPWPAWLDFLESIGARELPHQEIARRVAATGDASGWWAQAVAVAYEQHIGRRQPGQRADGAFEVTVSRTLACTPDEALALWIDAMAGRDAAGGAAFEGQPAISRTDNWRYWRRALADGSRTSVTIGEKGAGKVTLAVTQDRLAGADDKERWRAYWKAALAALG